MTTYKFYMSIERDLFDVDDVDEAHEMAQQLIIDARESGWVVTKYFLTQEADNHLIQQELP
jgi:hypothetical protein